ncbi:glutathione S-transferase [Aspergillus karnatakaensis]|uniref:glutathione S-transferase family protein n=1 Tax=Aspergillus karnatakaensis TaxID=1810916 RepID=UPI003CCE04FD
MQPIKVYTHVKGANPWKVIMVLNELSLPYETISIPFSDVKSEPYISINPNGRLPAIEDPNTNITLWESGAIMEYLVETYDKGNLISFAPGTPEYFHAKQFLHFQMSGQGPYFGQAVWFVKFHSEMIASAQDRYIDEIKRVSGVLERVLEKSGQEYLVGGRFSYADAAFVPWYLVVPALFADRIDLEKDFPRVKGWLDRLEAREGIAKALRDRVEAMAAGNE